MSDLQRVKKDSKAVTKSEQNIYQMVRDRKQLYEQVLPDQN